MILILTQCFPSRLGGIESLISNLALSLSKSKKIIVFADRHHIFYDAIFDNKHKDEILVRRVGGLKFFRRRKKIKEIRPFIESKQVELVISDSWKSLELGIDYLNIKKIPTICLSHGNELLSNNVTKSERIKNTLNKVNSIVANSLFTKNLVKNLIKNDLNVDVIYPGALDLRNIDETIIPGIKGKPIVVALARLEKRKGHLFTIQSIKKLISEFPELKYIIAGIGPESQNLKKLVKLENLEENVMFVGNINDSQKKYLFKIAKLMIMPTLDETHKKSIEGFGIAYLEAAFFGIPSIASNIGGTPEAVINNYTGKIINDIGDLYSTIRNVLMDENKIAELGRNAQIRAVQEFNWNYISKKYLSLINSLIKNTS